MKDRLAACANARTTTITAFGMLAAACWLAFALAASTAQAFVPAGEFGSLGSGDGQFDVPQRIAVKQSANQVFVVDRNNDRVQVFQDDASGDPASDSIDFVQAFGGGELTDPVGIAINQTSGEIYVTDAGDAVAGDGHIVRFNPDFTVAGTFGSVGAGGGDGEFASLDVGIAIDPSTSDVLVPDRAGRVQRFAADGTFLSAFDGSTNNPGGPFSQTADQGADGRGPSDVAVASDGSTYVVDTGAFRVDKFDSTGSWLLTLPGNAGLGVVAVDPATGDMFVTNFSSETFSFVVVRFDSAGSQLETFAADFGGFFANPLRSGLVVNPGLGRVYLAERRDSRVLVFGPPEPPVVVTGSPSELRQDSARVSGTVNPGQAETAYRFEYGTDTSYGGSVPVPDGSAGSGADPVELSELIEGLEPGTTYHYRLVATNSAGTTEGNDQTFTTLPELPPSLTTAEASAVLQATARLSGTVDPEGAATGYRFEYGADTSYGSTVPVPDEDVGAGTDPVDVIQELEGLDPGTTYHFRLVAASAAGTTEGEDHTFTTLPALPPDVSTGEASDVTPDVATLGGTVDPNGAPTTYRFEYGADTSYGSAVPVPDRATGDGSEPGVVSEDLLDLQPGTTYHFRLIATNSTGETAGQDAQFTTPVAPPPPPVRRYELVSPADDGAYDVSGIGALPPASPNILGSTADGLTATFVTALNGTLPGMSPDGDALDVFVASRASTGWVSKAPLADRTECSQHRSPEFDTLSLDGSAVVLRVRCLEEKARLGGIEPSSGQPLDQVFDGTHSLYRADVATDIPSFVSAKFGVAGPVPRTDGTQADFLGGSPDLSFVYFTTSAGLLPGMADAPTSYLYRYEKGITSLVTRDADGQPFTLDTASISGAPLRRNAVSQDGAAITLGSVLAMLADDADGVEDVYQVRGGSMLRASDPGAVPPGNRPDPQSPADRSFEGASADGSRLVFSTVERMTADDTDTAADLYLYDLGQPANSRISRVSRQDVPPCAACDDNADSGDPLSNSAARFSTLSDDGRRVFFITGDVLASEDDDEQPSLYARDLDAGRSAYVAPAGAGVTSSTDGIDAGLGVVNSLVYRQGGDQMDVALRPIKVSRDGTAAAFLLATDVRLPAGRGGSDSDGERDLYVWSAQEGLRRVRQGPGPTANTATLPTVGCLYATASVQTAPPCRAITDDGGSVFFETVEGLVADDTNGLVDVYAVDTSDGTVRLISRPIDTPVSGYSARYVDSSSSGDTVFLLTRETLDPSRDTDGGRVDLYAARTGSVHDPLSPLADCEDDGCQGAPSAPPARTPVSSNAGGPSDNVATPPRLTLIAPGSRAREQAARRGLLRLRVRTTVPGRLSATAVARVEGRLRRVASAARRATRAGATVLPLSLSRAARQALHDGHRLRIRVRVTLPGAHTRSMSVVLTPPGRRAASPTNEGNR